MISLFLTLNQETIGRYQVMFIPRIGDHIKLRSGVYIVSKVTRCYNEDSEVSIHIDLKIPELEPKS